MTQAGTVLLVVEVEVEVEVAVLAVTAEAAVSLQEGLMFVLVAEC